MCCSFSTKTIPEQDKTTSLGKHQHCKHVAVSLWRHIPEQDRRRSVEKHQYFKHVAGISGYHIPERERSTSSLRKPLVSRVGVSLSLRLAFRRASCSFSSGLITFSWPCTIASNPLTVPISPHDGANLSRQQEVLYTKPPRCMKCQCQRRATRVVSLCLKTQRITRGTSNRYKVSSK